jgi:uncharacterized protein involved in type VI secretion and phage assembly
MIASGTKACVRKRIGAFSAGTTDVIFAANTGDTEEMQRHKKFANAGHFSFENSFDQFESAIYRSEARLMRLWGFRKPRAPRDAMPTSMAERKYPSVKTDVRGPRAACTPKYVEGKASADTISSSN